MVYNPFPPYEILQTKTLSAADVRRLRHFARVYDLVANSGNFVESTPLLWREGGSPFHRFLAWSEWLGRQAPTTQGVALPRLLELFFRYLVEQTELTPPAAAPVLWRDYQRGGRHDPPPFLRAHLPEDPAPARTPQSAPRGKRQARHGAPAAGEIPPS